MPYLCRYPSPLGAILLCADETGLTGGLDRKAALLRLEGVQT